MNRKNILTWRGATAFQRRLNELADKVKSKEITSFEYRRRVSKLILIRSSREN